jgi:hypothetical protein
MSLFLPLLKLPNTGLDHRFGHAGVAPHCGDFAETMIKVQIQMPTMK